MRYTQSMRNRAKAYTAEHGLQCRECGTRDHGLRYKAIGFTKPCLCLTCHKAGRQAIL